MCGAVMWVLPQRTKETKKHRKKYRKDNTAVVKMLTLKLHRNQSQETSEWFLVEILLIVFYISSILTRSMFVFLFLIILT